MPLPSQSARPTSRRSHMYSRRRHRGPRRLLGVLGVIAIMVLAWWFWPGGAPEQTAGGENEQEQTEHANARQAETNDDATRVPRDVLTHQPAGSEARNQREISTQRPQQPAMAANTTTLVMGEPVPSDINDTPVVPLPIAESTDDRSDDMTKDAAPQANHPARSESSDARIPSITTGDSAVDRLIRQAIDQIPTRPVDARLTLSQALQSPKVSEAQRREIRDILTEVNETLVFSPAIVPGDPFAIPYTVQDNDLLQKIVRTTSVQIDWRFAARINRIDPKRIRPGQRLKLITGPFHAVVDKSEYRLDLYLGDGSQQVYVRSFDVGLGQYNSTPEGLFRIKPRSKAVNPAWVNPRTGEAFDANDPENPIGEYWIGLEGVDRSLADVIGYGIHGTTEPQSIGQQASMGCVRLGDDDVELMYEVLVEEASLVRIVP